MWPFNRHKHTWEAYKIYQGEISYFGMGKRPASQIYYKCECGKRKLENIDGLWELSDFE